VLRHGARQGRAPKSSCCVLPYLEQTIAAYLLRLFVLLLRRLCALHLLHVGRGIGTVRGSWLGWTQVCDV
jgi:hypothetical protein